MVGLVIDAVQQSSLDGYERLRTNERRFVDAISNSGESGCRCPNCAGPKKKEHATILLINKIGNHHKV